MEESEEAKQKHVNYHEMGVTSGTIFNLKNSYWI